MKMVFSFFNTVNILMVWHAGFLGRTTHALPCVLIYIESVKASQYQYKSFAVQCISS